MLSILLLSHRGEGNEIASRLSQDGHVVKFWVSTGFCGAPQEVHKYYEHVETADLIVACSPGVGGLCEQLRSRGKLVLGGGVQDSLTEVGTFAQSVAKLMNLKTEETLKEGISVIPCGWFLGDRWGHTFLAQSYRRLLDGERGPKNDSMGYLVWRAEGMLDSLTSFLASVEYRGFLGVKIELVDDVPYFLGFETSLAGGLVPAVVECSKLKLTDLLMATARGQEVSLRGQDLFGVSVRVLGSTPLYSTDLMSKHIWVHNEAESLGYVTAAGDSPREARRRCYRTIGNATTLDMIYRSDIGAQSIYDWQRRM